MLEALSYEGRRLETSWESKLDLLVVCAIGIKKYIFMYFHLVLFKMPRKFSIDEEEVGALEDFPIPYYF